MAGAIWLNAKSSTAATGRSIVSYAWDLQNDGRLDYVAPGNAPAISTTVRKPGNYTASLTVTDSAGESDTFTQPYSVGKKNDNKGPSFTTFEQPASGSCAWSDSVAPPRLSSSMTSMINPVIRVRLAARI